MNRAGRLLCIALIAGLSAWQGTAEVSVNLSHGEPRSLSVLFSGGDIDPGPNPWPMVRDHVPPFWVLNPAGDQNVPPDGFPAFGFDPVGETFEVVWARHDGSDFELVVARWEGTGWSEPVPLTDDGVDESEPVLAYGPDGTARLGFVRPEGVYVMRRPPGGAWGPPEWVDGGEHPSVAATPADRVAYQRPAGGAGVEIVASERRGSWVPEVLASTTFAGLDGTGDVDVRLHASGTRVWLDWEQDAGSLGWAELGPDGRWSPVRSEPISGPEDEEAGRLRIARRVLR